MSVPELGLLLLAVAGIVLLSCAAFGAYAGRRGVARRRFEEVVRAVYAERAGIDRERRELAAILDRVRQDARERQTAEAAADRRIRFLEGQVADLHRSLLALQPPRSYRTGETRAADPDGTNPRGTAPRHTDPRGTEARHGDPRGAEPGPPEPRTARGSDRARAS